MKLEIGKKYLIRKNDLANPKQYEVVPNAVDIFEMYTLDIHGTKTFKTAYYDSKLNVLFNVHFNRLTAWSIHELDCQSKGCECGGFKTYNSYEPHYHSRWCPINEGKVL